MLSVAEAIPEQRAEPGRVPDDLSMRAQPIVLRGVAAHWPLVHAAKTSAQAAVAYLQRFVAPAAPPAVATVGPPEIGGRIFYNADLSGFNVRQQAIPLGVVLDTLLKFSDYADPATIYVASTTIDTWLPGLNAENSLELQAPQPLASIWIGNRTRIAAHQDLPDNLACVAAGRRRVTLFPPDQLANLYVGPLDYTPAGQPISLVDFSAPDLERFPRFAQALEHAQVAELGPGDAVFIPSMWWHHMEGLDSFNVLVNYWWRLAPAWMDTPMNALMYALMTVRDLPPEQRVVWQEMFRHYVFEPSAATADHIPEPARRALSPLDEPRSRELRARLLQRLNR